MRSAALFPKDRPYPICVMCRVRRATILDHKEPHLGDPERFWKGPFQTLCKPCHDSIKQRHERLNLQETDLDGYRTPGTGPKDWVSWDDLHEPKDLEPSAPELTMIFGPPGAGKTTYLRKHARARDEIIDADIEARKLGYSRFTQVTIERINILKARNDAFRALATSEAKRAWSTGSGAKANVRGHWVRYLKPKKVIVMKPDPDECVARIMADEKMENADRDKRIAAAKKWFKEFEPRGGEKVIQ